MKQIISWITHIWYLFNTVECEGCHQRVPHKDTRVRLGLCTSCWHGVHERAFKQKEEDRKRAERREHDRLVAAIKQALKEHTDEAISR